MLIAKQVSMLLWNVSKKWAVFLCLGKNTECQIKNSKDDPIGHPGSEVTSVLDHLKHFRSDFWRWEPPIVTTLRLFRVAINNMIFESAYLVNEVVAPGLKDSKVIFVSGSFFTKILSFGSLVFLTQTKTCIVNLGLDCRGPIWTLSMLINAL